MSIFSKIGNVLKKALPVVGGLASFIPGVGGLASSAANAIGGLFSAKSGASNFGNPEGDNLVPQKDQVSVTGQKAGTDWAGLAQSAVPLAVGGLNYIGQRQTNAANAQQAQKQMDFQNAQTSTAYQRGTADMRAAGLNPMLAYSQGGASSGAGASAVMGNELGSGANSALSAAQTMQQLQSAQAQIGLTEAQTDNVNAQTDTERNKPENVRATTEKLKAELEFQQLMTRINQGGEKEQIKMFGSARAAKDAEAQAARASAARTSANTPGEKMQSDLKVQAGKPMLKGMETINSAADAAGQSNWINRLLDALPDVGSYGEPLGDKLLKYGKPKGK